VQKRPRGFTLFIAIVLAAVAATVTLALTSLAYKSLILSSSAKDSQYAFYAADTALDCALYWDNSANHQFLYQPSPPVAPAAVTCAGAPVTFTATDPPTVPAETVYQSTWFPVNGSGCARITVYKTDGTGAPVAIVGSLYGDGVSNATCAGGVLNATARTVERGLKAFY
jgi:Tfp pilus assembly protein PilX